MTDRVLAL
jgi:hypothetical protein